LNQKAWILIPGAQIFEKYMIRPGLGSWANTAALAKGWYFLWLDFKKNTMSTMMGTGHCAHKKETSRGSGTSSRICYLRGSYW